MSTVCGGFVYASTLDEKKNTSDIQWAYPHPYNTEEINKNKNRYLDPKKYCIEKKMWNLKKIVERWDDNDDGETWPWVWCWHNPNGPHHIFIGVDEATLSHANLISKNARNNLTLVISNEKELDEFGYKMSDFHSKRCAIHISKPEQIDFENKILMLEDERVICYDRLYIT